MSSAAGLSLQYGKWLEIQPFALQSKRLKEMLNNKPKPSSLVIISQIKLINYHSEKSPLNFIYPKETDLQEKYDNRN